MSLSRRSSSSRSIPVRRPLLSISKASAGPSLSLVVAESEPRKRKDSASASLKGMWVEKKDAKVEPSLAEDSEAFTEIPREEAPPEQPSEPEPAPEPAATTTASMEPITEPDAEASSIAFPSTSPPSRSWFGSLGRTRGRDKARVYVESTLKESTTADPTTPSETSTLVPHPPPSPPSEPQPIPTNSSQSPSHSVPSSIDEHVPPLSLTPPSDLQIPQRTRVTSSPSETLNSLNPSTSRFTLSIPLLGRPKVPLDEVIPKSLPEDAMQPQTAADEEQHSASSSTYSWWGYVGWSGEELPRASTANESATTETKPPEEPEPAQAPVEPPRERAMSVLSSDTTSRASWYSPWSWYYSAPQTEPAQDNATADMTESERIKEEALARPETTVEEEIHTTVTNTITDTASASRSSWTSFFTTVNRKTLEAPSDVRRDGHGNEIMDIDEDEDTASVASKPPSPSKSSVAFPESTPEQRKPEQKRAAAPPLTISEDVKKEASSSKKKLMPPPKTPPSPKPSITSKDKKKEKKPVPPSPPPVPNFVLPTWDDIFHKPPRAPPAPAPASSRLLRFITGKGKSREDDLPCILEGSDAGWARACNRVVVLGIHGWFPGAIMRTMLGEPTGTSPKFVAMMEQALQEFQERYGVKFEKVTGMPLEGEGTIGGRVEKLYTALMGNESWVSDLHDADAILVATHSQGSVVSTHLLNRLIEEGHIVTALATRALPDELIGVRKVQRICCLALCGIHLGPLRYLNSSSLLQPYFQYLETQAARELFEFQNTNSDVSKSYVEALRNIVHHGTKMVYVASLNDQVVPLYSGLFTSASHPLILRALYMDGDAYHSSDFLSNLLVLLIRCLNSGLSDSGLISLLSETTAGSLNGVGHSTAYEEKATYSLAVDYLFLTTPGPLGASLAVEEFDAGQEQNDYEIPWALRDLIADERVRQLVGPEFGVLRSMFGNWKPRTAILRDVKRKLGPIQRLGSIDGRKSPSKL